MKKSPKNWIVISSTVFAFLLIALIILLQNATQVNAEAAATHFTSCAFNTGNNGSVLIPLDVSINGNFALEAGDEIAVYTANGTLCAGVTVWTGTGNIAVAAWGDNDLTPAIDGLQARETMQYRIWDQSAATEITAYSATYETGNGQYQADGAYVMTSLTVASDILFLSPATSGTIDDVKFKDEDIIGYDAGRDTWFMYMDGTDVDLIKSIDAFHIMDNGDILISMQHPDNRPAGIPGVVYPISDADILKLTPSSTGINTSGTWSMYFDGSDVGLDTANHDIDAIGMSPEGKLLISMGGSVPLPGLGTAGKHDLVAFTPTSLGNDTAGSWEYYFDGTDVGLSASSENVRSTWVDTNGDVYLSTLDTFEVPGPVVGDGDDILRCVPGSTGASTTCTYNSYWDGPTHGFSGLKVNGLSLRLISNGVAPAPSLVEEKTSLGSLSETRQPKN